MTKEQMVEKNNPVMIDDVTDAVSTMVMVSHV